MRLDGRRRSSNVDDRRRISGKTAGIGGGIVGVIIVAVLTLLGGGDIGDVIGRVMGSGAIQGSGTTEYVETEEDARLADLKSEAKRS